jgi:hypothetical protein
VRGVGHNYADQSDKREIRTIMRAWSYSSLKDFEGCAKRYYSTRVAKTHKQDDTAEHLLWGNRVHQHCEDRINIKAVLPDFLQNLEPLIADLEARGRLMIAELEFAFRKDWTPCGYWDKDCWTRGKIDVVCIGRDEADIIDWKTGKRRPDFGQLEYYALALGLIGYKKIRGYFVWTKTFEYDSAYIDEAIIRHVKELFTAKAARLERAFETNEWPAKTSALCAYCPVVMDCEEAREKGYHKKAKHIKKARQG